jgi:hypothetical protein
MRISSSLMAGAVVAGAACGSANAAIIAAWDFQTTTNGGTAAVAAAASGVANTTPKVYVANFGSGTLYLDGSNYSSDWILPATGSANTEINAFSGTALNADTSIGMSTTTSGAAALALTSGARSGTSPNFVYSANGKAMVFKFSMTNLSSLNISLAMQRTSSGFTTQVWESSVNGTNWSSIGTVSSIQGNFADGIGSVTNLSAGAGINGAAIVYVRVTLSGTTGGNNRLDNIIFSATAVPAPGAMALVGVAGLLGARRRR